jgi:DNA polymerase III subunit epsilon
VALKKAPNRVIILDIESTGLSQDSYPTEIAYGDPLESWVNSSLIKPHPNWESIPWTEQSKTLTGITPDLLKCAQPAIKVASKVARDLSKADLILSDAPEWDTLWLNRLLDLNKTPADIEIKDFQTTINQLNPLRRYLSTYKCLNFYDKSEHRAGGDVIRLIRVYRRAIHVPLQEEQYCPLKNRGFGNKKRPKFLPGIPE